VDVCKIDAFNPALQILSEASHDGSDHWYTEPGLYLVELLAQGSSFWTTPARCIIWLEYGRDEETGVSLGIAGSGEHRHLLRIV
jgi:hypothetical protein